ncbi:MAG: ATP-grasp domain-containing protein [Spirochaetales bacterium]|nr:ATP-grasp domain-containing protein [Spirochaetales bacterium]
MDTQLYGKHLLILGAGVMQLPAIHLAKEMGLYVTVADGNPSAPGRYDADCFLHVDLKDKEQLALSAAQSDIPVDGVFTAGTDFSASVAWVAARLGLPGIPYETALAATDKALMREAFSRQQVPSPRFVYFDAQHGGISTEKSVSAGTLKGLEYPLVVKPVDNMGARGIRRVDTLDECRAAVLDAFSLSRNGRVIVEEYIEGDEYSIDALVWKGRIYICGIADRHITFPPYFIEMGHTMPTAASRAVQKKIVDVFTRGIKAIGIHEGAAKGDIKVNARGAFVGEIAARLSGGYMSGWTYPYAAGILPAMGGIRIALGYPPFDRFRPGSCFCAEHAYISVPGKVKRVRGVQEALAFPHIKNHFSRVKPGDIVVFPRNNVEKCGNFIGQAATRKAARSSVLKACRNVCIELEPDNSNTMDFLTAHNHTGAYFRMDRPLQRCISSMPLWYGEPQEGIGPLLCRLSSRRSGRGRWYGDRLEDVLRELAEYDIMEGTTGWRIGRPAWLAIMRGGAQGGRWFFQTLDLRLRKGDWKEWLSAWT